MAGDDHLGHRWGASYDGDVVECLYCAAKVGGKWAHEPCDGAPGVSRAQREGRWVWEEFSLPEDYPPRPNRSGNVS
jgi:hypothetical protein